MKEKAVIPARANLAELARKRLERFAVLFAKALANDAPETIHDLRVACRRLQQVLRLVMAEAGSNQHRKPSRLLRKTRRAFGACRNLDVSLDLVKQQLNAPAAASLRRAWEALAKWLEGQRAGELGRARGRMEKVDLIGSIVRMRTRLAEAHLDPAISEQLSMRLRSAFTAWKDSLATAQAVGDVKSVHALRIAGKRLRYRAELLAAAQDGSAKRLVQELKGIQDHLGYWHDRFVLRQHVGEFIGRPDFMAEEPGMCRALLLEMEREKQRDQAAAAEIIAKAAEIAAREMGEFGQSPAAEAARDQ